MGGFLLFMVIETGWTGGIWQQSRKPPRMVVEGPSLKFYTWRTQITTCRLIILLVSSMRFLPRVMAGRVRMAECMAGSTLHKITYAIVSRLILTPGKLDPVAVLVTGSALLVTAGQWTRFGQC